MTYDMGRGGLDYLPCRYGASKILFRGPRKSLDVPYIAMLGGTETYGKYVEAPFADQIEAALRTPCVNLGCLNAGIDAFAQDASLMDIAAQAQVTVIQVMGAQNMSNRLYSVHPRRNDRFVKPSSVLQMIYREVDFTEFNFNRHMLMRLQAISAERFETVCEELRSAWVARMNLLLARIPGKTVLLWASERSPDDAAKRFDSDPWLVGREELNEVSENVTEVVEVVFSKDAVAAGTQGMVFAEMERPAAESVMNAAAHAEVSAALKPVLSAMV
ncbi:MAG: DUF6473 family protein [Pseudomonadota bacterium]